MDMSNQRETRLIFETIVKDESKRTGGRNISNKGAKAMNLSEIDELTAKLKKKGDITKKEATAVFAVLSTKGDTQRQIEELRSFPVQGAQPVVRSGLEQIKAGRKGNSHHYDTP